MTSVKFDVHNATMVSPGDRVMYEGKIVTLIELDLGQPHEEPGARIMFDDGRVWLVPDRKVRALTAAEKEELRRKANRRSTTILLVCTLIGTALGTLLGWLIMAGVI